MIPHKCPSCGSRLESPEIYAGRKDKCPACGQAYIVPDPPKPSPLATALSKVMKLKNLRLGVLAIAAIVGIIASVVIIKRVIKREADLRQQQHVQTRPVVKPPIIIETRPVTTTKPTLPATIPTTKPETVPTTKPTTRPTTETAPATRTQPVTRPATVPATKPTTKLATLPVLPPLPDKEYAKTLTLKLGKGAMLKLYLIRAGRFVMGSPDDQLERKNDEPRHWVTIGRHFYLAENEVTKEQHKAAMDAKSPAKLKDPEMPVTGVSWHDSVAFCKTLSKLTGRMVRLPTEAQWEYACRAGTSTVFNTGDKLDRKSANYNGKYIYGLGDLTLQETTPWPIKLMVVRSFKPNAWGLYDTHGNVAEWCRDWSGPYRFANGDPQKQTKDPAGSAAGTHRVLRGGSWQAKPAKCRSAARDAALPEHKADDVGLRILVEVEDRDAVN